MTKLLSKLILVFGLSLAASLANASLVLWTLNGVTFGDGSTASGSFIFDAGSSTFGSVLITTSNAGTVYDTSELSPVPFGVNANGIELVDNYVPNANAGKQILNLDFLAALTNAGGVVGLVIGFPSFEGRCIANDCSSGSIDRIVTAGTLNGVAVPEPTTLALLGAALAGLAMRRRRN